MLGAGAVGSFLGARLSRELPTTLVAREAHAMAITSSGLRLGGLLSETVRVDAAMSCPETSAGDLVVVTVKARSLDETAAVLAGRAGEGTTVLCTQNGLDPDSRLRAALRGRGARSLEVLRAITGAGCDLVRPGEVHYWGGGMTFPDAPRARPVARLFERAGVEVSIEPNFDAEVWRKLAVNCVANPLSAVLGVRNREVVSPELSGLRRAVVEEVALCALDAGVELGPGGAAELAERIDRALSASDNRNSMLQDMESGRPTEIGELNGRVAELARASGREAPACATLERLVRFLETRPRPV